MKSFFLLILLATMGTITSCQRNGDYIDKEGNRMERKYCELLGINYSSCMFEALKYPDITGSTFPKCVEQYLEFVKEGIQSKKLKTDLEKIIIARGSGPTPEETSGECAEQQKSGRVSTWI